MGATIYTTPTCPRCKVLKEKMANKGIDYVECQDSETLQNMGIDNVPVLEVDGETMDFGSAVKWINGKEG